MAVKLNFFPKPVSPGYSLDWDTFLIELSLGVICAVMAVYGWGKGMLIVAIPCAVVAISCIGLVILSLVSFLRAKAQPSQADDTPPESPE